MKRIYQKPTTKVVQIHHRQMLCGSPYDNIQSPVETYDSEGDDINDIQGIW